MIIIGIDLGTTNSLVSYWTEDGGVVIPNSLGEYLTPSVVSVDENGEILVGKVAKERQISHPDKSAAVFKRYMGSKKMYKLGDKEFLPEELSSLIIRSLKEDAEHHLGINITEAVISVPAYFSDSQRKATKRAGELAGLKVERLITEPTAAAMAYGIHQKNADTKFLVFDLGGGTFDVSILELFDNVMEVRAVAGDNYLGGEDFTDILVSMFLKHHSLTREQLCAKNLALLKKACEVAKREFCDKKTVTVQCLIDQKELTMNVTMEEYESSVKTLLNRLREPVERALNDASLKVSDIEYILLVGGATRLPIIRTFVSKLFGRLAWANIDPDKVVALGAGVQAELKGKSSCLKEMILTDVCPYTLGTSMSVRKSHGQYESGHFLPIIERNTIIPVSRVERLYTVYDNQSILNIDVLQGESRMSKDNIPLGELNVPIPPKPAGQEAVDIRFTYDINGILEAEVTVVSTGIKKSMVIEKDPGYMSKEEIATRLENLSHLKMHPRDNQENKLLIARGERLYEESTGQRRFEISRVLRDFEDILDKQDLDLIKEEKKKLKDFLDAIDTKGVF